MVSVNRVGDGAAGVPGPREFPLFWAGRFASTTGYHMQAVGVGWLVYDLTRSAFALGLVGLVQFAPMVALALVAGHAADRFERQRIARLCQAFQGVAALLLALAAWSGGTSLPLVLGFAFLIGATRVFENPSLQALVPRIVPPGRRARAFALSGSAVQGATVLGPALGGLLYLGGPRAVFVGAACAYFVASLLVGLIRATPEASAPVREPATWATLSAGIRFIGRQPALLGAISLDLFAVLLGGATALLPIYARDILRVGPAGLGMLRSAPAFGAVLMALALARWPLQRHVGRAMFAAVAVFGVATIVFGLSRVFGLSLAALFVLGAADMVSVVIRAAIVQLDTPDSMRGRVSAVNYVFIGASNQLGEFESGLTAAWFGTVPSVVIGGIGTLLVVAAWSRLFPQITHRDQLGEGVNG
ncbi:MAG TPA: MFS transporter [Burkholderiaceae bacterium]|nr:MFS transporter [Burkholderiaceae bacterium]